MKPFHAAKRFGAKVTHRVRDAALVASVALLSSPVFAQGTDPFDAAVTSVTAKVNLYWPQLVGIAAIAVAFAIGLKYVRKIRGAA
jgi:hypothetical protein